MSPTETISWIGHDLAIGESVMAPCPFCGTAEKKLAVTRYGNGLGYVCFRASCDKRGSISEFRDAQIPIPRAFEPCPCPYLLEDPRGYAAELLERIDAQYLWGVSSNGDNRVVYSLGDVSGKTRGWQSRTRDKKVDSGKLRRGPLYGYYAQGYFSPAALWVVEDPLSAIRLAEADQSALALLGTRLDDAIVEELWDEYPECKRIYVALDPGAEDAARKIVTRLRFHHGLDAIQVPLPDDIHRLDSETFQTILEAYK